MTSDRRRISDGRRSHQGKCASYGLEHSGLFGVRVVLTCAVGSHRHQEPERKLAASFSIRHHWRTEVNRVPDLRRLSAAVHG